jgi:hypothetical protein
MAAAVGYAPDGSDAWLVFDMRAGAYNDETLIESSRASMLTSAATSSASSGTARLHTAAGA